MRAGIFACLTFIAFCASSLPARADYFVWQDEKTGFSISYPDTWRQVTNQQPDDLFTVMPPSGRAHAECRVRVDGDRRFMIYPPRFQDAVQKLHYSQDFWSQYASRFEEGHVNEVKDEAGLGRGFAGYADISYIAAVPGPEMRKRALLFGTVYRDKAYILECSAQRDAYDQWRGLFLSVAKSIDFLPGYHQLESGNYRDFTQDPRLDFRNMKGNEHELY